MFIFEQSYAFIVRLYLRCGRLHYQHLAYVENLGRFLTFSSFQFLFQLFHLMSNFHQESSFALSQCDSPHFLPNYKLKMSLVVVCGSSGHLEKI